MTKQAKGTINDEKIIIKIEQDTTAESPRELENDGTMVCFHEGHNLGDEHNYNDKRDFLEKLADEHRDTKVAQEILSKKAEEALVYTVGQSDKTKAYILISQEILDKHKSDIVSTWEEAADLYFDKKETNFKKELERRSNDFEGVTPEESKRMTDEIAKKMDNHYNYDVIAFGTQFVVLDMNEVEVLNEEKFRSKEEAQESLAIHKLEWMEEVNMEDLSNEELLSIIEEKNVILPLYLYEHGGITMRTGDFSCSFSDDDGWIYASKESLINNTGYSKEALFQLSIQGTPKEGDWVKAKGHENKGDVTRGFGYVVSIQNGMALIDFDYTKIESFKKAENLVEVPLADITGIKANLAVELLIKEVEIYNQYLIEDIYGFTIEKVVECKCCGHEHTEEIKSCWNFYGDNPFENNMTEYIDEIYHPLLKELA